MELRKSYKFHILRNPYRTSSQLKHIPQGIHMRDIWDYL